LQFQGNEDENVEVAVFTATGFPVETQRGLPANKANTLGRKWAPGMYIVKVNRGGKLTTHMVVKK
jgi:hypothetical protein